MWRVTVDHGQESVRTSWHGMEQSKPKLPYYFRTSKRLRSLDEFEPPPWKGQVRFGGGDGGPSSPGRVMLRCFLIVFLTGMIATAFWRWLYGNSTCAEILAGFKIGWC